MPAPRTRYLPRSVRIERPELVVLGGPHKGEVHPLPTAGPVRVGASEDCDLVLQGLDPEHVELELLADRSGVRVSDRSAGRTRLNGAAVDEAVLGPGDALELGEVQLRLKDVTDPLDVLPSEHDHFGPAKGRTLAMREIFGALEVLAPTDATLLLLGETGTGKDVLAHAVHEASDRKDGPLVIVDGGAIAPSLVESELFGHERGAFTGAETTREGAFERADGGTLFIDEVGELPLDVQPKLLRALDERQIQPVGGAGHRTVNVRVVAATKRNLEEEVARGHFREDLYFRLAVLPITLPPLRERRDDIPVLVEHFVAAFEAKTGHGAEIPKPELQRLLAHDWPGNVRELKNTVERALWLAQTGDGRARFALPSPEGLLTEAPEASGDAAGFDPNVPFSQLKQAWEADFEKNYVAWLLARADGSLSAAARMAQMDRKHLRNLARKHGLWKA